MKKNTTLDLLMYTLMLVPAIYLGFIYASLPSTIPVHFNFHGPDGYAEKAQSWVLILIMTGVSFGIYQLLRHLPFIDPKKTAGDSEQLVLKIATVVVIFLSILQLIIITAMRGNMMSIEKLLIPVLGIFFAMLGNLMLNIKPNYFIGIRVPWTLENEDNWRKTHRLAGKLWFSGGILSAIVAVLLPYQYGFISFMVIIAIVTIIPVVYSYYYFKKHRP